MLAGRKLLLADDSITIQKIVALTFADEGIEVVAVGDGAEAVEKLEEISPDVVLADVFMPGLTGYQVCEHIKGNERLKHIKVMLLVGSFEPFDEVEARRVGADDTLTKPFQSIRNLVDKVSALLGRQPVPAQAEDTLSDNLEVAPVAASVPQPVAEVIDLTPERLEEMPEAAGAQEPGTLELLPPELVPAPEDPMSAEEMELTTANTKPLSPEIRYRAEQATLREVRANETILETETMQTNFDSELRPERTEGFSETLLELDDFESGGFDGDEVMLDVDFESPVPEFSPASWGQVQSGVGVAAPVFASVAVAEKAEPVVTLHTTNREVIGASQTLEEDVFQVPNVETVTEVMPTAMASQPPHVHQPEFVSEAPVAMSRAEPEPSAPAGFIKLEQLSPEVVDAIARRVIEQLSERTVQEIAWEVVPQLADLIIRRQLDERDALNK